MMKIEKGNVFYTVNVNKYLIVDIQKVQVESVDSRLYSYKVLEQIINRDFEIPETLEEKYNKKDFHYSNHEREKRGKSVSGTAVIEHARLYEEITEDLINDLVEKGRLAIIESEGNSLKCPITGGKLIKRPHNMDVMDGGDDWIVVGHKEIQWTTGCRVLYDVFSSEEHGHFKWNYDTKEWVEQVIYDGFRHMDKPKTFIEEQAFQKILQDVEEKNRLSRLDYIIRKKSGEFKDDYDFPIVKQYQAKLTNMDKIEVKPMSAPLGVLFYMDVKTK